MICSGCQRNEMHKRCPAHDTPFYMSGVSYTKEIEALVKAGLLSPESAFETLKNVALKNKRMEGFPCEIHITMTKCRPNIEASEGLGHKMIEIEDLDRYGNVVQTSWMTSIVMYFTTFAECMQRIANIEKSYVFVNRVKVEVPPFYLKEYGGSGKISEVLYAECHIKSNTFILPTSRNVNKPDLIATAREWKPNSDTLEQFIEDSGGDEVELCLYDSCVEYDYEWISKYAPPSSPLWTSMLGKN